MLDFRSLHGRGPGGPERHLPALQSQNHPILDSDCGVPGAPGTQFPFLYNVQIASW